MLNLKMKNRMKKKYFIGMIAGASLLLGACDYNDKNFEGLDDLVRPVSKEKYELEYTEKEFTDTESAKITITEWLEGKIFTADTGSLAVVKYKLSSPVMQSVFAQDFERTVVYKEKTEVPGWVNYTAKGEKFWYDKVFSGNTFTEFSGHQAEGECEGWLISPKSKVKLGMTFEFSLAVMYYNADCLSVYISSDFAGNIAKANWMDVSDRFAIPSKDQKDMAKAGVLSLDDWNKQDIVVAFKYSGDGENQKTTTYQLDDIAVNAPDTKISEVEIEYVFRGNKWVFNREIPKYALKEDMDNRTITAKDPTLLPGWMNVALKGKLKWYDKSYKGNNYSECSAYSSDEEVDTWLITPKLNIFDEMIFSFDVCTGHYTVDGLSVLISTDFDGVEDHVTTATWTDVSSSFTIPQEPTNGYGVLAPAGKLDLKEYLNKNLYIAFRYVGNKNSSATTTYQVDNIFVGKE